VKRFGTNFIKEIKTNFKISETRNLNDRLCELLDLELDMEKVARKYQDSIVAASNKSFKARQLMQKNYRFQVSTLVDGRTYCNEEENQRHA
jgi:hypothetical protein